MVKRLSQNYAQPLQQKTCLADGELVYVRPREPHWDWCGGGTVYCMLCMQCLKKSYLAYNTCPPFYIYLLYMIYYCSVQAQSTAPATPRAMVCCLKLLSAIFGNAEVFHAPMGWWKASTMFFGADAFSQSIGAWNMSAVTDIVPWS